ncbi:MAG: MlaE family ABC transporter permease [Lentisphaeria bacterium]
MGRALVILFESYLYILPHYFRRRREIGRQMYICGVKSIGIVSIVAFFTGMIIALQAGLILRDYNQEENIGTLVAQTLCREMGPFMTALIIAASIGSAIAAEIGTMTVSEEISALQVMSINPASYLVMPRSVALFFMVPALVVLANILGVLGGMVVGDTQLAVDYLAYYRNALSTLGNKEIYVGLFKSLIFSQIIVGVSCYQGFFTSNGAIGVGHAARKTVVHCFLLILVSGYFITRFFYD